MYFWCQEWKILGLPGDRVRNRSESEESLSSARYEDYQNTREVQKLEGELLLVLLYFQVKQLESSILQNTVEVK